MNALRSNIVDGKSMTSMRFSSSSLEADVQEDSGAEAQKIKEFSFRGQMHNICQHGLQLAPAQMHSYQSGHRSAHDGCAINSAGTTHESKVGKLSAAQHAPQTGNHSFLQHVSEQVVKPTPVINKVR